MRDQVFQPPGPREVAAARRRYPGRSDAEILDMLEGMRNLMLSRMQQDPFRHGYEPPIWYVAKALLRNAPVTKSEAQEVERRTGLSWPAFAERMRSVCGFAHPVGEIIIMGANRSGKTDFASRLTLQVAMRGNATVNVGMQTLPTGKQVQMPRMWHYMPEELKRRNLVGRKAESPDEHISYSKQNGFSGSKITFANGSAVRFVSYDMDVNDAMEGSALDEAWLDEESPHSFVEAARFRLASKRGLLILTFTPISGYTPVVADFLASMQVTQWHTAYMLPTDGGPALPWRELGLAEEEWTKLMRWRDAGGKEDPCVPEARPENVFAWCGGAAADKVPDNREFLRVPRVAVCKDGEAAAVWFYGSDNPYGMPGEVIANALKNPNAVGMIRKRVYGIAEKIKGRMFPEFTREKNVCRREDVPKTLVRIHVVDPAPDRNWTCGWYGLEPKSGVVYKYREWPGNYEIPTVGVPGPWAVPSDRRNGINDGDKGEAQDSFGMGFLHYKFEWARLEGWADWRRYDLAGAPRNEWPEDWDEVEEWSEANGTMEPIEFRVIDSRAASQTKTTSKENLSLFEEVAKLAEGFQPASGQRISVGLNLLRDRIATGRYIISEDCPNTIAAYEMYTGADGQKGACKDFIDCDRYMALSGLTEAEEGDARPLGEEAPAAARGRPETTSRRRKRAGGR